MIGVIHQGSEALRELYALSIEHTRRDLLGAVYDTIALYLNRMYMITNRTDRWGADARVLYEADREKTLNAIVLLRDDEWNRIRTVMLDYYDISHNRRQEWNSFILGWVRDLETLRAFG